VVLDFRLFGTFSVRFNDAEVPPTLFKLRHPRLLLQMLALQPGLQLHRDQVLERLWPDSDSDAASNRLYHTLHALRGLFSQIGSPKDQPVVLLQAGLLRLNPAYQISVDVQQFRALVEQARGSNNPQSQCALLDQAAAIYKDELLRGSPYEDWLGEYREQCHRDIVWVLNRLAQARRDDGQADLAIASYQRLVEIEPADELAHRALIELFHAQGHPERAVLQYATCKRYLQRDLDAEPSPKTQELIAKIVAASKARPSKVQATESEIAVPRYVAPSSAIALLGREADLKALSLLIGQENARLVTITGTAGLGKTRLALALAERCQDRFVDGVVAVALTSLNRADQLADYLASNLGIPAAGEPPAKRLELYFANKKILLVLDRFEHILPASNLVSQLLSAAPGLTALVTSQTPLRCTAERVYELPTLWQADREAAVNLFLEVAANSSVRVQTPSDIDLARQICQRLDGNALAIELAAAQTKLLSLQEILQGLAHALEVLTNPIVDVERQHRSLRDAIKWSYGLLDRQTQGVFAMLGAFAATFTLQDAAIVLQDFVTPAQLRLSIQTLLDRHLLTRVAQGKDQQPPFPTPVSPGSEQVRFTFLDANRQFASELAGKLEELAALQAAHANYFAQLITDSFATLRAGKINEASGKFEHLRADTPLTLLWMADHAPTDRYFKIASHASALVLALGSTASALEWLGDAVAARQASTDEEKRYAAWCYFSMSHAYAMSMQHQAAIRPIRMARKLMQGIDDHILHNRVTTRLAITNMQHIRLRTARCQLENFIHCSQKTEDAQQFNMAYVHHLLGAIKSFEGKFADGLSHSTKMLDLALKAGNPHETAIATLARAEHLTGYGDLASAASIYEEWIKLHASEFTRNGVVVAKLTVGFVIYFEALDFTKAQALLEDLKQELPKLEYPQGLVAIDIAQDMLAVEAGRHQDAQVLLGLNSEAMPFDLDLAYFFVQLHCYTLRLCARRKTWWQVCSSIEALLPVLRKTGNPLWHAWLCESLSDVLLAQKKPSAALALLLQSERFLAHAGLKATPRQKRHWKEARKAASTRGEAPTQNHLTLYDEPCAQFARDIQTIFESDRSIDSGPALV
jgi:DNA-binding SARP family transcriptional activator